jgi:hypothetical protein
VAIAATKLPLYCVPAKWNTLPPGVPGHSPALSGKHITGKGLWRFVWKRNCEIDEMIGLFADFARALIGVLAADRSAHLARKAVAACVGTAENVVGIRTWTINRDLPLIAWIYDERAMPIIMDHIPSSDETINHNSSLVIRLLPTLAYGFQLTDSYAEREIG